MKISELEELLATARKAFGDREIGVVSVFQEETYFEQPQLTKWFLKPESEDNFSVALTGC